MKKLIIFLLCVGIIGGGGYFGYKKYMDNKKKSVVVDVVPVSMMMPPRMANTSFGFNAPLKTKMELDTTSWMQEVIPQDLVKFGLIPELVGRLPVLTALNGLDETALVRILEEPKDSLIKQYKKLFEMDGVSLEFGENALLEIAKKAIERHTGARGLRSIMEELLKNLMYEAPSDETISKIIITADAVTGSGEPIVERGKAKKKTAVKGLKKSK